MRVTGTVDYNHVPERIEWLDNQPKSQKFSREYLYRFKAVMGKRLRRMRKWK